MPTCPAGHEVHEKKPPAPILLEKVPIGHGLHAVDRLEPPVVLPYVPAGHRLASHTDEMDAPVVEEKVPARHGVGAAPFASQKKPAGQVVVQVVLESVAPVAVDVKPAGHTTSEHVKADWAPVVLLHVYSGHGVAAVFPCEAQK